MTDDLETLNRVADVLDARLTVARVLGGKLDALEARTCPDGRLRGGLAYYGAHTGRWSGRGAQMQNFPRPPEDAMMQPEDVEDPGDLGGLLRGVVRAPRGLLATADASQIEARILLWLAGDAEGLQVYIDGGDPYKTLAATVFDCTTEDVTKLQRAAAKIVTLACGFQGGRKTLAKFCAKAKPPVNLAAVGITAASLVEGWRDAHQPVAGGRTGGIMMPTDLDEGEDEEPIIFRRGGLWRALSDAATVAVRRATPKAFAMPGFAYSHRSGDLYLRLPSGRELRYRDARIEPVPSKWTGKPRPTLTYRHPVYGRKSLYGGLLCENACQAIARDILAGAMVRLEAAGIPVVLHVHDEVVCEVERAEQLDDVIRICSEPPEWADGLPIQFEGGVGVRWSK